MNKIIAAIDCFAHATLDGTAKFLFDSFTSKLWPIIHLCFRCTVVLFNSKKLSQTYLLNTSRKAITAVAYSQCGRYLATGECGINPTIKVWELDLSNSNESNCGGTVISEFSGHKYAVNCVVSL